MMHLRTLAMTATLGVTLVSAGALRAQVIDIQDGGFSFTLGGQINRGILFYDDGVETGSISVDNDNSSTRLRARLEYDFGDYTVGWFTEYEFEFSSTAAVNQLNTDISSSVSNERFFEAYVQSPYGRFTYGQGDAASNSTSEVDLSGTSVVGYSGVADFAGGLLFRNPDGSLSSLRIGSLFSNLDGNSRIERFRYDSPTFGGGLVASVSFGESSRNDLALRYNNTFGDIQLASAISLNERRGADRLNGSVSALHKPSGVSLTVAAGRDDLDDGSRDPEFGYIKLGYQTKAISKAGTTAFGIDYYNGSDIQSDGSDSDTVGVFAVQNVDKWNLQLYIGYRTYSASAGGTDFQDVDAVLTGFRWRF